VQGILGNISQAMFLFYANFESVALNTGSGADSITVNGTNAGTPVFINAGPGTDAINVNGTDATAPAHILGSAGNDTVTVNVDGGSPSAAVFDNTQAVGALSLGSGGNASIAAGGDKVLTVKTLNIPTTGASLDLNDNDMILDYTGASQLAAVQAKINSARTGGTWAGTGITSSNAKNHVPKTTTLGAMEASEFKTLYGPTAMFDGQPIDSTAVLIKYTYYGDANFDGKVNFDDYARIDAGFNAGRTGWLNGDFSADGKVNFDDYALIDAAFNGQSGTLGHLPLNGGGRLA
jgi:hypothetical protein